MSGSKNSSLSGSTSNLPDNRGQPSATSSSGQSVANSSGFYNTGSFRDLSNIPSGSLSTARVGTNNLPVELSQISHGGSLSHSGISDRRGMGAYPIPDPADPRFTGSMGNMVGGGNARWNVSSSGLPVPGVPSRISLISNTGSGSLGVQGQNRLMGGVLPQGSAQAILGQSYGSAGVPLSQGRVQAVNSLSSMGMLNEVNSNDQLEFPHLVIRPNFAEMTQGQIGSQGNQNLSTTVPQNQEFNIHNENFPALPGSKGSQQTFVPFNIHNEDFPPLPGSKGSQQTFVQFNIHNEDFPPLPGSKGSQQQHAPSCSGQLNQNQQLQVAESAPEPDQFGLLGLVNIVRSTNPDQALLALGTNLTKLGLNMKSDEDLHKTFSSPWSDEPFKGDPEYSVPQCYNAKEPHTMHHGYYPKFSVSTLFFIFYSMPRDEAQLYAANELHNRGWLYHKELGVWLIRVSGVDPVEKTHTYERATFHFWDPNTCSLGVKENFLLWYDQLEERPALPQH